MSSWPKSSPGSRRAAGNPNGSSQKPRFRRAAPYPGRGDERSEVLKDVLDSYEELEQMQKFSASVKFEGHKHQSSAKPELRPGNRMETCTPADRRKTLYQKFYRQVQEERKPPDCVVISVTNECLDYPKSLSKCLQERGLSVEMLYLHAESGLTRALQDVRAEGSPLCILVEQTNIALSSCTVIIFSESLKIHRNMPKDQAMDLVSAEHGRGLIKERPLRDPADVAAQTSQLLDDYLDREKIERHSVSAETRQLLMLLAEGVHLYPEELEIVSDYVQTRQDYVQASDVEEERGNMVPQGLGKPPPLLPTPPGPPQLLPGDGPRSDHSPFLRPPLLPSPGSYPKTKPPPLLSLHQLPGPLPGGPCLRGPPSQHSLLNGPPGPRGPLIHNAPLFHPGPRGLNSRGSPPSFKSSRPPLLSVPGPLLSRLSGSRH